MLSFWFMAGLYLDGWAHNHLDETLDSFFTPWHGVFYSGFLALALYLGFPILKAVFRGENIITIFRTPPLSCWGIAIFFLAGIGDMMWHIFLGIEVKIDALLSPTHLFLALGASLMLLEPLHTGRVEYKKLGLLETFPTLLPVTFFWSVLTFFTMYVHPTNNAHLFGFYDGTETHELTALALSSLIVQCILLSGIIIFSIKKLGYIPRGAVTTMLTLNAWGMSYLVYHGFEPGFIASSFFTGLVADFFMITNSSPQESLVKRAVNFATLPIMYTGFFSLLSQFKIASAGPPLSGLALSFSPASLVF